MIHSKCIVYKISEGRQFVEIHLKNIFKSLATKEDCDKDQGHEEAALKTSDSKSDL